MGAAERMKGKRRELEVVHILHEHGWGFAQRTSRGDAQKGTGDIRNGPAGCHIEITGAEKVSVPKKFDQVRRDANPLDLPVLVHRPSRHEWMATLPLDELLPLLALKERA